MHATRFRILGPLEIDGGPGTDPAVSHTPNAAKMQLVLGTLLAHAGEVVSVSHLIDELWPQSPPRTATTTLQVYVSQVRKRLAGADPRRGRQALATRSPGYLIRVDPDEVDAAVFEDLSKRGGHALADGDFAGAAALLHRALELWRGPLLSGIPHGPLLQSAAVRLDELRMTTLSARIRADLQLGRHAELVAELQALTAKHPLREDLYSHLMVALYRCGRPADALQLYAVLRRTLVTELGVEPGPRPRRLHQRILAGDRGLLTPSSARQPVAAPRRAPARSAGRGPVPVAGFVGRGAELAEAERLLRELPPGARVAVAGMPGCGKTAFAVQAAVRVADAYPGGTLVVDLRPGDGRPVDAGEAVARLLRAGGAAAGGDTGRALREVLGAPGTLLVLDHVSAEAQVRPLLRAAAPGCTVLLTCRRLPPGLEAARTLVLGSLAPGEAAELLASGSTAGAPAPLELAALCGGLPAALRVAGALLAARPHESAAGLAVRLRDEHTRLSLLRVDGVDVRALLLEAYDACPAGRRRDFALLGLLPPGDFAPRHAAAVLGLAEDGAQAAVEALADARLVEVAEGGYRIPELLRLLAAELLATTGDPAATRAATERMCALYAEEAAPELPGGALARLVRAAHHARLWQLTVRLAAAVPHEQRGESAEAAQVYELALEAARRCADRPAEARLLRVLGDLAWQGRRLERARELYGLARTAARRARQSEEYGRSLVGLAELCLDEGAAQEASALLESALAAVRGADDPAARYEASRAMALLALEGGEPDAVAQARRWFGHCLELAEALGDARLEAFARRSLRALAHDDAAPGPWALEIRPGLWRLRSRPAG
ncbi:AfsR/SARP family transcriptional regulator [Streptomyces smaragdinus]|uniref:AfsR/SARP family transcriptional regulator n=1 Tax=Streptomyces smaragdinus TaxID=2585196 RepID=UPI0012964753|nr:AfsR/SARP family transcriptional regulator [Streptomyces smaragdinus]